MPAWSRARRGARVRRARARAAESQPRSGSVRPLLYITHLYIQIVVFIILVQLCAGDDGAPAAAVRARCKRRRRPRGRPGAMLPIVSIVQEIQ